MKIYLSEIKSIYSYWLIVIGGWLLRCHNYDYHKFNPSFPFPTAGVDHPTEAAHQPQGSVRLQLAGAAPIHKEAQVKGRHRGQPRGRGHRRQQTGRVNACH